MSHGSLKNAIIQHFASMVITQETHNDVPVCWSAGKWNAQYWATASLEDGITQLFVDLGLGAKVTAMKHAGLNAYPGQTQTNAFLATGLEVPLGPRLEEWLSDPQPIAPLASRPCLMLSSSRANTCLILSTILPDTGQPQPSRNTCCLLLNSS